MNWIKLREGKRPALSQIAPEGPAVNDMINEDKFVGVFLLQPPEQPKMGRCLKPATCLI